MVPNIFEIINEILSTRMDFGKCSVRYGNTMPNLDAGNSEKDGRMSIFA